MVYRTTIGQTVYAFGDLKEVMAKATPLRSGDMLAGIAASTLGNNFLSAIND